MSFNLQTFDRDDFLIAIVSLLIIAEQNRPRHIFQKAVQKRERNATYSWIRNMVDKPFPHLIQNSRRLIFPCSVISIFIIDYGHMEKGERC